MLNYMKFNTEMFCFFIIMKIHYIYNIQIDETVSVEQRKNY